jgi:hypothetical protein
MPRLNRSLPTYRKHKASGQAVVTINRRDYYLGPMGPRAVSGSTIASLQSNCGRDDLDPSARPSRGADREGRSLSVAQGAATFCRRSGALGAMDRDESVCNEAGTAPQIAAAAMIAGDPTTRESFPRCPEVRKVLVAVGRRTPPMSLAVLASAFS